jgi:glutathione synthase/RimK-type ligase-like ATP-grasp enzyme
MRLHHLREKIDDARGRWWVRSKLPPVPKEAVVPLDDAADVILLCSRMVSHFDVKIVMQELAFAHELVARNRSFALTHEPRRVSQKSVVWFLPNHLVSPRLWNYSQQVREFAAGLESQGNRLLCSADEVAYWENKAMMHRRFEEVGLPTPMTRVLTAENWSAEAFDIEPMLIKEEHSAGSAGIHYFATAEEARRYVVSHRFSPSESLIMQELVDGATKDLRLTMVGDQMIHSATFWRRKSPEALASRDWTTTASKYGSSIEHRDIPESVVGLVASYLRKLGLRVAGVDLMWVDDDVTREPLVLEVSPYFQPNPPKPDRYRKLSYKQFKDRPYADDGYFYRQYHVFREIAAQVLDQRLF